MTSAATAASAHYGRPVAPFTVAEAGALTERFRDAGSAQERAALLMPFLDAPAPVRQEAIRLFERVRGDEGGLPAGSMALVMDQLRDPARAPQALSLLTALATEAPKPAQGEGPEIIRAVEARLQEGVPAVRSHAIAASGDMSITALQVRDRQLLERLTRQFAATDLSATEASRRAAAMLYGHLGAIDLDGLAHVYLPRTVLARDGDTLRLGLERLREEAAAAVLVAPEPPELGGARGDELAIARARREERPAALASGGVWINAGGGFVLVAPGSGQPVELKSQVWRATLDEVLASGRQAEPETARREERGDVFDDMVLAP